MGWNLRFLNYLLKYYNKFITLRTPHNAQPFLKSTFEDVWKNCENELKEMKTKNNPKNLEANMLNNKSIQLMLVSAKYNFTSRRTISILVQN